MNTNIRIEHSEIQKEFLDHFLIYDNQRILFSAPFGTGKSTFIQEFFFENESINFISLTLFPVNYSVAANEDVFELIKYDLLLELLSRYSDEIEITKEEFGIFFSGQYFIYEQLKPRSILSAIINLGEKLGKPVFKLLKVVDKTISNIEEFKKKIELDEKIQISNYIKEIESKSGSINEMDDVSQLIFNLIHRLITKRSNDEIKFQSVLIIDDLDRLDPDHIFRLFNIFSSHYDIVTGKNKFGFDKVIFVCDIDNIRKIYFHKYGSNVDFSGYIDKFYSKDVFEFDNIRFIKENVNKLLGTYNQDELKPHDRHKLNDRNSYFYDIFSYLIFVFLDAREINLRMLVQKQRLKLPTYKFYIKSSHSTQNSKNYDFLVLISYLKSFFVSYDVLEQKLKRISEIYSLGFNPLTNLESSFYDRENVERNFVSIALPFLLPEEDGFPSRSRDTKPSNVNLKEFNVNVHYGYENTDYSHTASINVNTITATGADSGTQKIRINIFLLLYETFKRCRLEGFLK